MNKKTIIENIAKELDITKVKAQRAYELVFENIEKGVKKDKVTIPGFGTFRTVKRAARNGVNPATGEKIKIKASKSVAFKPSATLKAKFNK
jgi:nucleoid DNA-binding protein